MENACSGQDSPIEGCTISNQMVFSCEWLTTLHDRELRRIWPKIPRPCLNNKMYPLSNTHGTLAGTRNNCNCTKLLQEMSISFEIKRRVTKFYTRGMCVQFLCASIKQKWMHGAPAYLPECCSISNISYDLRPCPRRSRIPNAPCDK